MTLRARVVLDDVRAALAQHSQINGGPTFRTSWFAVVGLLRSIGHVLEKVDAATDRHLANAVSASWKQLNNSKPEPAIFWGFIEAERNRFLKNYEHGITRVQIIRTGDQNNTLALDLANAGKGVQLISVYNVPADIPDRAVVSILSDGPFAGNSEVQVAAQAIEWWDQYLLKIEAQWRQHAEA